MKSSTLIKQKSVLSSISEDAEKNLTMAIVTFKNGNVYKGQVSPQNRLMHGFGKFTWSDGTVYEVIIKYRPSSVYP